MKILCAWCGKVIGGRGSALSHGICRRCFQDYFQGHFEFLDTIPMASAPPKRLHSSIRDAQRSPSPWADQPGLFEGPAR
jgi:hypothetical protein